MYISASIKKPRKLKSYKSENKVQSLYLVKSVESRQLATSIKMHTLLLVHVANISGH